MLRSRVTLAVIGMLIIGGLSALAGALTTPGPKGASLARAQGQPTASATTTTALATPTATIPQQTDDPQPTASVSQPTSTPSSQVTLHGSIATGSINQGAQTFTLNRRTGGSVTIVADGSTQYQGNLQSFNSLSNGMFLYITGKYQPDGSLLASVITTPTDN